MNTLVATEAKTNRALVVRCRRGVLPLPQERGGQQIDDLPVRMPRHFRDGGGFVMKHGGRSVGERCSCCEVGPLKVTQMQGNARLNFHARQEFRQACRSADTTRSGIQQKPKGPSHWPPRTNRT